MGTTLVTTSSQETMASTTVVTTSSEPETEPESEPEDETSPMPPASPSQCGSCMGCMWSHGLCYMDASKSYCESWSDNTWCGASLRRCNGTHPSHPSFWAWSRTERGQREAWSTSFRLRQVVCVFEVKRLASQSGHKYQGFFVSAALTQER